MFGTLAYFIYILDPSRKQFDHDNKNFFYTANNNGGVNIATCRSFTIEHKGDFERISIESVRTFMNSGKCCVLVVPPQVFVVRLCQKYK